MQEVYVERTAVNYEALDAALKKTLGGLVLGISTGPGWVRLYLDDNATQTQQKNGRTLIETHDPTVLSPEQQAEATFKAHLAKLRQDYGNTPLEITPYATESGPTQALAQKVAWLEAEIQAIRSGERW